MWIDGVPLDTAMILDAAIPLDLPVRAAILIAALGLDALLGDPPWLWVRIPHPVVMFGRATVGLDRLFNRPRLAGIRLKGKARRSLGVLAILTLVGTSTVIGGGLAVAASTGGLLVSIFTELLLVAILLAGRSLADHVKAVAISLEIGTIEEARKTVSKVVGRNTKTLDKSAIARAAIETTAENLSDGLVAPALFYLALGLPGIFAYKMINTADSMIGYRSAKCFAFGWGAARLDDLANLVPARLSGIMIVLTKPAAARHALTVMLRDAPNHSSLNAGWPEAAMAAQLDLSLSGPRYYGLRISKDQEINRSGMREAGPTDIACARTLMWRATMIFALIVVFATLAWVSNTG